MNAFFSYAYDVLRKKKDITMKFVDFKYNRMVLKKNNKTYVIDTHGKDNMTVYAVRGTKLVKLIETNDPKLMVATLK